MKPFIDYSQWKNWMDCPAKWFELAVNKRTPRWPKAQRNDPLCLGGLVHDGLQVWQESREIRIPEESIERNTPDGDTLNLASSLVYGYVKRFPAEPFTLSRAEAPLRFPLTENMDGLAKIDHYFYCPEETEIESGIEGGMISLSKGWWIQEYKTKGAGIPLDLFMKKWQANMQVVFQMLALGYYVEEDNQAFPCKDIQGVLISVIEKPNIYIPKRTCKSCRGVYEYNSWLPSGDLWACPICGGKQKLTPPERKDIPEINCYRIIAQRNLEQLALARVQIQEVALQMEDCLFGGKVMDGLSWNREKCVEDFFKRTCSYFRPHILGDTPTVDDEVNFQMVEDYVREVRYDSGERCA